MDINQFIADFERLVEPAEIAAQSAAWDAETKATPETLARSAQSSAELARLFADRGRYDALQATGVPADPLVRRQRDTLLLEFAAGCIPPDAIDEISRRETELGGLFGNFRAQYRERSASDSELRKVLMRSDDGGERRDAWAASKQIGDVVADKLRELVKLRNQEARRAGFADYYSQMLTIQEIGERELLEIMDTLDIQTEAPYNRVKADIDTNLCRRFDVAIENLKPWHYGDPFFQEAPSDPGDSLDSLFADVDLKEAAVGFFGAIGLPIRALLPLADLYERPGKSQHAFCNPVGRGTGDIRVCCNLQQNAKWMGVLLHEFGHAVYHNNVDSGLPFFLRTTAHIANNEAIAQFMGRLATDRAWLVRWAGVSESDAARVADAAHQQHVMQMLILARWVLVMVTFERALYTDPDQDLDQTWWRLVSRFQHLTAPDDPIKNAWAAKIHLSLSPVYYHSYLMGEAICSQILHHLRRDLAIDDDHLVADPRVGAWLTANYFAPGKLYAWNDHIRHATGEPLNVRYFVDELTG